VLTNRLGNRVVAQLQVQLFGRLIRADLARLREAHTGSYVASVLYDAGLIREAATTGLVMYVQNLAMAAVMLVVMAIEEIRLTVVVLVAAPVISWILRWFVKRTRGAAADAMDETSALSTAVMESLAGVKIVKIENREADEEARVGEVARRRLSHLIRGANAKALAAPATDSVMSVVLAVILAYAGWRSLGGHLELPNLVSFIVVLTLAGQALRFVANYQPVLAEGLAAAERLFAILDVEPRIADRPGATVMARAKGQIRFEDVRFGYVAETPALDGVSLAAEPGQSVALVGPSGGGKSTILSLIPRFYDVESGRITLDGVDIRDLTLASLRAQIALVTQEPFLFDDTIAANIAYSRPGASREEIIAAAQAAAAHEFILETPGGYDAKVGEAGARLSGGQRQRIAIARAFLKDAPILLLDEATSALDTESEAKVQEALERLMAGRTTILIAHRLSTVRGADVIHVIDRGKVVETGRHDELSAKGGLYARLAKSQNLEAEAA
jgi:subfamily B ATP-binding cassette protein MsbA